MQIRHSYVYSNFTARVCAHVVLLVTVSILLYSWQWETPCTSSQVCPCISICEREREREETRLSHRLHAVTKESRLWGMPGCQEHPTIIQTHSLQCSALMANAVDSVSSFHLDIGPHQPILKSWFTVFVMLASKWDWYWGWLKLEND